jgi:hypothetical protein
MKKIHHTKQLNPLTGSIIGGITGAVAGAAIVSVFNNKNTREKVLDVVDKTVHVMKEINDKPNGMQTVTRETLEDTVENIITN